MRYFFPKAFHNPPRYRHGYFQEKGHAGGIQDYVPVRPLARHTVKERLFQRGMGACHADDGREESVPGAAHNGLSHRVGIR